MKSTPIYILIILLIAVLVFKCDDKPAPISEPYEVLVEVHDTIVDTLDVHHYHIKTDSVFKTDFDTVINDYNYKMSEYHYKVNDSLLNGTIIARSPFKPAIDFNYKLKNYTIKDSIVVKENNYRGFLYGGSMVVSPLLTQISATGAYQFKRGDIVNLSFGRDFVSNHNLITVGYLKRF